MKKQKYKALPKIETDIFLIGTGIMSATLGAILKQVGPKYKIMMSERLSGCGLESSEALNNAGTGHAGYCELNYTPEDSKGNIDISKAIKVNNAFEKSKEFWQYLIEQGHIKNDFYSIVPHYVFVNGNKNVSFLKKRYEAMSKVRNFNDVIYSEDFDEISNWLPLMMKGRDRSIPVAITKAPKGTDIDFGKLTNYLMSYLINNNVKVNYNEEVIDLYKVEGKLSTENPIWNVIQRNCITNKLTRIECKFLFIGAGGAAITLLEKSGITEAKHYGGFPVSGQWLICDNPEVVKNHKAKVYGKPAIGSPPMSVPHLDTRIINGKSCLLFGPYAGMSTKFLKNGSWLDFFKSIKLNNIWTMLDAGIRNIPLTRYLMRELFKNQSLRFKMLQEYFPNAKEEDWKLGIGGQRVQVIKKINGKGVIEFGTEIVSSEDCSIAALLGASPGASTSVKIMLDLMNKCFGKDMEIENKLSEMIPSYNEKVFA